MQVNASGEMTQTHMRKMDGSNSGGGKGNGMQDIMQALSPEERTAFREELSLLSQTDRAALKDQLKTLAMSGLSSKELSQTLTDFLASLQEKTLAQAIVPSTTIDIMA